MTPTPDIAPHDADHIDRDEYARGLNAFAIILGVVAWLLFLSAMNSELLGASGPTFHGSYLSGGAVGGVAMLATAIAGRLGTPSARTCAGATFVMLLMPTFWGAQIAWAMAVS